MPPFSNIPDLQLARGLQQLGPGEYGAYSVHSIEEEGYWPRKNNKFLKFLIYFGVKRICRIASDSVLRQKMNRGVKLYRNQWMLLRKYFQGIKTSKG